MTDKQYIKQLDDLNENRTQGVYDAFDNYIHITFSEDLVADYKDHKAGDSPILAEFNINADNSNDTYFLAQAPEMYRLIKRQQAEIKRLQLLCY